MRQFLQADGAGATPPLGVSLEVGAVFLPELDELRLQRRVLGSAIETAKRTCDRQRNLERRPAGKAEKHSLLRGLCRLGKRSHVHEVVENGRKTRPSFG